MGYPGMLFHLWRVVDLQVQQIAPADKQAFILRRQMGGRAQEQK